MTVLEVLSSAARLCGSLAAGESLNATETADFFQRLNDRIDELNTDRLNLLPPVATTLTAGSAKRSYAIGPTAGDFNQVRPVLIQSFAHVVGGIRHAMEILDSGSYASITDPAASSIVCTRVCCDFAFPIANLLVWPVPSSTPTFEMYAWTQVPQYTATTDVVTLPPAWRKFLQWDLALQIAADLGTPDNIVASIQGQALQAQANMRAINQQYLAPSRFNPIPLHGIPMTTGMTVANPLLGGPVQMVPPPGAGQ